MIPTKSSNPMKQIITFSILAFFLFSCQPKDLPTVSDIHKDFAEVKFSHMTTKDELFRIKSDLRETSNIELDYSQTQFLDDGHIQTLKIGVRLPNGTRGSTSADLMKLQFNYYGFLYNPKNAPTFKVGAL